MGQAGFSRILISGESPLSLSTQARRIRVNPAVGTVALLLALNLLNYIDRYILSGEMSPIQHEFHSPISRWARWAPHSFVFYMIAAPLTGWLGDRFRAQAAHHHRRHAMEPRDSGRALDPQLLHALSTPGAGRHRRGHFRHLRARRAADFYPERERNRILSVFYIAIPVGAALGYLAGGQIGTHWGWRAPFLVCALPGLCWSLLYMLIGQGAGARRIRPHPSPPEPHHRSRAFSRNPAFLTATFGLAMLTFAMGGISFWMPEFLRRSVGLSMGNASLTSAPSRWLTASPEP